MVVTERYVGALFLGLEQKQMLNGAKCIISSLKLFYKRSLGFRRPS